MPRYAPTLVWDAQPAEFIEALVESNAHAFYLQLALETVLGSVVLDEVSRFFVMNNQVYRVHRTPPFLGLPELYVTFTVSEGGQEVVIRDLCFVSGKIQ